MTKASNALLIGDFAPLHLGHLADINDASKLANTLHIVITAPAGIATPSGRTPNLSDVARWVQVACQHFAFVRVHTVASLGLSSVDFDYRSSRHANHSIDAICQALQLDDVIIASKHPLSQSTYPTAIIAATLDDGLMIQTNPLMNFDRLAPACRYFYTQTVCIVGGESSGKTTLIHKLANHYGATVALEMGRLYTHSHLGGTELGLQYSDYLSIAINHAKAITDATAAATAPITLIDTDFATTQAFCEVYEKRTHPVVASLADNFRLDFTIYLDNNVAWVADGMRRLGDTKARSHFAQTLLDILARHDIRHHVIDDDNYHARYQQAVLWIDTHILGKMPTYSTRHPKDATL